METNKFSLVQRKKYGGRQVDRFLSMRPLKQGYWYSIKKAVELGYPIPEDIQKEFAYIANYSE